MPFVHFSDFHFLFTPEVKDLYRYVVDIKKCYITEEFCPFLKTMVHFL